jgi:GntR family transcriptional regulator
VLQVSTDQLEAGSLAALLRPTSRSVLHSQIEDRLRRLIRSGDIAPGTRLPGEIELAADLGMSRHTVRHALGTLASEGLVRRERGRGTRVMDTDRAVIERRLGTFYAFAWEASARGVEQRSVLLEFATIAPTADLASRLALGADQPVKRIVRIRTAGDEPLVIETSYLPLALAEEFNAHILEQGSIYDEIERRYGLRVTRAQETIRPTVLSRALARMLSVRAGSPAFHVERTTWSHAGPIEWQESLVRGDRFLYSVELPRRASTDGGADVKRSLQPGNEEEEQR